MGDESQGGESHIDHAREELRRASDAADRPIQTQMDSIQEGLFEETDGELTRDDPGPKADRLAEVRDKLGGLEDETTNEEVRDRIRRARDHISSFLCE